MSQNSHQKRLAISEVAADWHDTAAHYAAIHFRVLANNWIMRLIQPFICPG